MEPRDGWGLSHIRKVIADLSRLAPIARLLGAKVLSVRNLHRTEHARASSVGAIRRAKA